MKLSRYLNSSALADYQQLVIEAATPVPGTARMHIRELERFGRFLIGILFWLPKGNLYIRQCEVLSTLYSIVGNHLKSDALCRKGTKAMDNYRSEGFYLEGWSYLGYCLVAMRFWFRVIGGVFKELRGYYASLVAPDGSIPSNDARWGDYRGEFADQQLAMKGNFFHPYYSVFRIDPDTFVMITHNPNLFDWKHRVNGHVNYDFGHIVLFSRGKWRIAHNWYEGYPTKVAGEGSECFAQNVILNGWRTIEPAWRLLPQPKLSVTRIGANVVELRIGDITRTVTVNAACVDVEDVGGDASVFNLDIDGEKDFTYRTSLPANDETGLAGKVKRITLTGKHRFARFWY